MPIARYQLPDGRVARFEVPEGTTPEQAQQIGQDYFAQNQPQEVAQPATEEPQQDRSLWDRANDAIRPAFESGPGRIAGNVMATFNQGLTYPARALGLGDNKFIQDATQIRRDPEAAEAMERLRASNPVLADEIENMGGLEQFLVGAGEGFMSLGRGVGLVEPASDDERAAAQALRTQSDLAKGGKLTAQAAPFVVPGGLAGNIASTPLRVGAMGVTGASEGNIIARGEGGSGEDVAIGTGLGLLLGAGGEAAMPLIDRYGRQFIRRALGRDVDSAVTPQGAPTEALQEALEQADTSFDDFVREATREPGDTAANAARAKAFTDLDLTPTEAQRTRDTDLFVEQQDAFRRGGAVKTALERQEEILDRRVRGEVAAMGGVPQRASVSPIEAVTDKAVQLDQEISQLYQRAREAAPEAMNVRFTRAADVLRENAPSNEISGGVIKALRDKMRSMGVLGDNFKPTGKVSVEQAEELRKYANRLFPSTNGEGRYIIGQFKDSLDDDVLSASGQDLFREARKAKASFESGLDPSKKNKFDARTVSLVRDMRDNLVTEDDFLDKVLRRSSKYKASDVKELRDYLLSGTDAQRAQGEAAWNDIRAAALDRIREKAFKGPITQTGTQSLSRAGLESALKEIGPQKFNVLFTPQEREFIRKLAAVSALKEPPPGTFTGSGPSSPAIQKLESTLQKLPVFGDSAKAIVESVRNKASDRRVLTLINDAEKLAKEATKQDFARLRRSPLGTAASALPAAAVAGSSQDNER